MSEVSGRRAPRLRVPGREGTRGWPGPGGEERGLGSDWRREASSRRCGWRFAGPAVSGEESPPRDAVLCVRHGPRLPVPGLPGSALPRPPRGSLSPTRQHLVRKQERRDRSGVAPGASAEMSPQSRAPSAVLALPGSFVRFRGVPSSQASSPGCAVLFPQNAAHGRGSRQTRQDPSRVRLRSRTRASARKRGRVFPPGGTRPGQRRRRLALCNPSPVPGGSRPSQRSAVGQIPARNSQTSQPRRSWATC